MQGDAVYFRGRAQEEIDAALAGKSTSARKAHLELAERYRDLAQAIEDRERGFGVNSAESAALHS